MVRPTLKAEDYTVGWICPIAVELVAIKNILDEEHQNLPDQQLNDTKNYILGRIGDHNVVIAWIPEGGLGIARAAAVANVMTSRFTSLRFGFLVGVGGGVPSEKNDIRLGDVVISTPQGQYGGVVQYTFGKIGKDGKLERSGWLNAPPQSLLTALKKMRADAMIEGLRLSERLAAFNTLDEFKYQGTDSDVLYKANHGHVFGPDCKLCGNKEVIKRESRRSTDPVLHYGTIASGDQVMKDARTRDKYSAELGGVLCFETEAAGLMNIFPCLAIRGICDYSDSHKNKRWQPYAWATAAVVAKLILGVIPASHVGHSQTVSEIMGNKGSTSQHNYGGGVTNNTSQGGVSFTGDNRFCGNQKIGGYNGKN